MRWWTADEKFIAGHGGKGMSEAKSLIDLNEFLAMPDSERGQRAEFLRGQILQKALPSGEHSGAQSDFLRTLLPLFSRRQRGDGSGGWWIRAEVSILLASCQEVVTPDMVGWKRDRVLQAPKGFPVKELPDWVCEVAISTLKTDSREKLRAYEAESIPFYWIVDALHQRLIVFQNIDGHLLQTRELYSSDAWQKIPPFDAIEISMASLFGEDSEDDERG